jgi:hypothetical protein
MSTIRFSGVNESGLKDGQGLDAGVAQCAASESCGTGVLEPHHTHTNKLNSVKTHQENVKEKTHCRGKDDMGDRMGDVIGEKGEVSSSTVVTMSAMMAAGMMGANT